MPQAYFIQTEYFILHSNIPLVLKDRISLKNRLAMQGGFLVGAGGFGPPKRNATDLQSAPFGHSGTLPY